MYEKASDASVSGIENKLFWFIVNNHQQPTQIYANMRYHTVDTMEIVIVFDYIFYDCCSALCVAWSFATDLAMYYKQ